MLLYMQAQKESVHNINGHTSSIARTHYIHAARSRDVVNAGQTFAKMVAEPVPIIPIQDCDHIAHEDTDANADTSGSAIETVKQSRKHKRHECEEEKGWGFEHPSYDLETKRAKWTHDELSIIRQKMTDIVNSNGGVEPANLNVLVLQDILEDPSAKPHFLYKHIETNLAIRNGIRKIKDLNTEL
jgi:hypothetical protein